VSKARTIIAVQYGDLALQVNTADALTPEGVETMLHKTRREFVGMAQELLGYDETEPTEDGADVLAALDTDTE
jgi:hypothetical protein